MSQLGDFLTRLYGPAPPFTTVHADVQHVRKARNQRGGGRREPIGRPKLSAPADPAKSEFNEYQRIFWAKLPEQMRMETSIVNGGDGDPAASAVPALEIVNGCRAWERDEHGRVEFRELAKSQLAHGGGLATEFRRHFDGTLIREFFAQLALEEDGRGEIANRPCVRIRAVPRSDSRIWPHWLPSDAEEYLFHADVERPILLAIAGLVGGAVAESHVVRQITFDEPIDPELFVYASCDAEEVATAVPISEILPLAIAAQRVPFPILVPALEPRAQWMPTEAMYHAERPGRWHEHVTLGYHHRMDVRLWINESAEPDERARDELIWESIDVGGRQFELSDPEGEVGMRVLHFDQDGAFVAIYSDLPRPQLLELAASFERFGVS